MVSTHLLVLGVIASSASYAAAQSSTTSSGTTGTTSAPSATATSEVPTEVDDCHTHSDGYYCFQGQLEWEVTSEIGNTDDAPDSYSGCAAAGNDDDTIQCADGSGGQVTLVREGSEEEDDHDHDHDHAASSGSTARTSSTSTPSASTAAAATPSATAGSAGNMLLPAAGLPVLALGALLVI